MKIQLVISHTTEAFNLINNDLRFELNTKLKTT